MLIHSFNLKMLDAVLRVMIIDKDRYSKHFTSRIQCTESIFHVRPSCLMIDIE